MNTRVTSMLGAVAVGIVALAAPASAFEPEQTFRKGAFVLSAQGAYGWQFELEEGRDFSGVEFWDAGVRFSLLPFDTLAKGSAGYGAVEIGLEPFYQRYVEPRSRFWAGLAAVVRYHFLALGRVVPYVEIGGSAGGTDLELPEIRSTFAFVIFGGVGASAFVTDRLAVYGGYRWQHVSNGNTSQPNRGFESNVAVMGVSFFF
jgi:opacity protein-like surface antigen